MLNNKSFIVFLLLLVTFTAVGQNDTIVLKPAKKKLSFGNPVDNAAKVGSSLFSNMPLLPVPIIITEPALGYGGGLALLYFHKRKKKYKSYVPNDVTGVGALITKNKTWGYGIIHSHTFGENRVRTLTEFVKPNINIDYYGNNSDLLSKHPITMKLNSWFFLQQAQVRMGKSHIYVGASYMYARSDVSLDTIAGKPLINAIIKRLNVNSVISSVKPMIVFDNRDNVFTPTKGINAELSFNYSAQWLGSSDDYATINSDFWAYVPVLPKLYSGYRFQGSYLLGDAPFYAYPYVSLRGIPAMRYQSDNTLVAETEWRYNIYKRFSIVAFTGLGKAFQDMSHFNDIDWAYTVGTGFRYEISSKQGTHMGIDFAWGNAKDFAFYIVFGSSWL